MKKEHTTYTQLEVDSNINTLTCEMDDLKLKRSEVSKQITQIKKQIVVWQELDKAQFKMF
jgi:FtsZ-binding cell division protein ZapB